MIPKDRPYLISETAYNHEGDPEYLSSMVNALGLGPDAVKFHLLFDVDHYIEKDHPLYGRISEWVLPPSFWEGLIRQANKKGKDVIALCDDPDSMHWCLQFGEYISAVEIHASGIADVILLDLASRFPGTVILGIGGCQVEEVVRAVDYLRRRGKEDILLMYGFQSYPTDRSKVQFNRLLALRDFFGLPMGYADHCSWDDPMGNLISAIPCAFGVGVIEKHFTLDKGKERIDYQSAVSPADLEDLKDLMETFWEVYGHRRLDMSREELEYAKWGPNRKVPIFFEEPVHNFVPGLENLLFKRTKEEVSVDWRLLKDLFERRTYKEEG